MELKCFSLELFQLPGNLSSRHLIEYVDIFIFSNETIFKEIQLIST